jgi:carbon-monoxide dehydrogenase medium subunit
MEDPSLGLLRHVASGIAYRAVRNRGTIGGSLAHADPAADWVSTVVGLNAALIATGPNDQRRRIAADAFIRGAFATALADNEVLVAVDFPRLSSKSQWGYCKLCRKTGEFAKAIGVAVLDPSAGFARVVAGAVEGPPILLPETAARLLDGGVSSAIAMIGEETQVKLTHLPLQERGVHVVALRRALQQLAGR